MGCWNGTCMISNLPIIYGEKIKLVFLQGGYDTVSGNSGYVYSNGLMSPAFLPISGEYNDYGSIENVGEDWNYKLIEEFLKKKFGNTIEADRTEKVDWTLSDLIDGIERGEPKYKVGSDWKNCGISMVMIRQDIWDLCVDIQSGNEDYWNPDKHNNSDPSTPYRLRGDVWANRTFDEFIEKNKRVYDDPMDELRARLLRTDEVVFGSRGEGRPMLNYMDYKDICIVNKFNDEFTQDIKKRWFEQQMVEGCISNLRKGWMIQPGAGSQSNGWNEYLKFSQGVINICELKINEY